MRPWSWDDVKPLFIVTGAISAMGAAIGAEQGATRPAACPGGVLPNAARGAGVYGGGFLAGTAGLLLGVRFLF